MSIIQHETKCTDYSFKTEKKLNGTVNNKQTDSSPVHSFMLCFVVLTLKYYTGIYLFSVLTRDIDIRTNQEEWTIISTVLAHMVNPLHQ